MQLARGYTPYGEPMWLNGTASSRYAFTGEDYDPAVGLVFLRARYMKPTLGIFLAKDPWSGNAMRSGSMNGWNYANSAPINYTDASGLEPGCDGDCGEEPPEIYTYSDETGIPLQGSIDPSTLPPDYVPSCEITLYTVKREVHNKWRDAGTIYQKTEIQIVGRALNQCFFNQWTTTQDEDLSYQGPEEEKFIAKSRISEADRILDASTPLIIEDKQYSDPDGNPFRLLHCVSPELCTLTDYPGYWPVGKGPLSQGWYSYYMGAYLQAYDQKRFGYIIFGSNNFVLAVIPSDVDFTQKVRAGHSPEAPAYNYRMTWGFNYTFHVPCTQ